VQMLRCHFRTDVVYELCRQPLWASLTVHPVLGNHLAPTERRGENVHFSALIVGLARGQT
jgi:hypothetical protein